MTTQLSQIKWGRVIMTALVVSIAGFLTTFLIVTAYAFILAFQARGAPDQTLIMAFADQYAPWLGPVSLILFTFLGALHIARRVDNAVTLHGIVLGVLVSLANIVLDGLILSTLAVTVLIIAAGWLGSRLSVRK